MLHPSLGEAKKHSNYFIQSIGIYLKTVWFHAMKLPLQNLEGLAYTMVTKVN